MKKLLSVVLALILVLSACVLAGCGADSVVGKWQCTVDITDAIKEGLKAEEGSDLADTLKGAKLEAIFNFEFKENGEFSMILDEDAFIESFNGLRDVLADYLKGFLSTMLGETGLSIEEALEQQGYTFDEFVDETLESAVDTMKESMEDVSKSGRYKVDGNKLYLAEDDDDFDDDEYVEFEFVDGNLKFNKIVSDDDDLESMEETLPWTLIRK